MAIELEFRVIPEKMREQLKKTGGNRYTANPSPLVEALAKGESVVVEVDSSKKIAGLYEAARRRNMKMTSRKVYVPDDEGKPTEKTGHLIFWTTVEEGV